MPEQLPVGVIGAGNMGRHHIRNYYEMPEANLVAIADPNLQSEGRELAENYQAAYYADYVEMLDDKQPSAVSIAVPTYLHYEIASKTLERGIHTLIEKPIARDEDQATDLIKLAKRHNTVLTVGHIERYNPVVLELKKMIDRGDLGTIQSIISQRLGGFPRTEPESDVVTDLAIHDIDIISYLMESEPEILGAHGTNTFHSSELDSAEILLRYGNASGFVQANWTTPTKIRQLSVSGSRGYVTANYITQEITTFEHSAFRTQDNFSTFVRRLGEPTRKVIKFEQDAMSEPLRRELGAFVLASTGEKPEMIVSPVDAVAALRTAIKVTEEVKRASASNIEH
jgi:predicted dehydrogenase